MKKSERKILEKQITEVVNVLVEKYEAKPTKKLLKIITESSKDISKKLYKAMKSKNSAVKTNAKKGTLSKTKAKVKHK